MCLNLDQ